VPVYGNSLTSTNVGIRLLPHADRVRLALEINGSVDSLTSSTSGPATFYNKSRSTYTASKPMEIDLTGIHLWPAEVQVNSNTRLRKLRTNFDGLPLVGSLVSGVARSKHEQQQPAATRELDRKIRSKAKRQIDSEADARLGKVSQRLRERILDTLQAMSLEPTIIGAGTSEHRLAMRLRLAGEDQLGSHTPRPRAPSDSLASLQVHETAINNVLQRMQFQGRTFTVAELSRHVASRLGFAEPWDTDPDQDDVTVTFAEKDPVVVHLRDGQVELTLSIAKLSKAPRSWKNFKVGVFYRPQLDGQAAVLTRQGFVHLTGKRLSTASQIALRGTFTRIFSKQRPIDLTPDRLSTDPKLDDLSITQFVVNDGWIAAALGLKRIAGQPRPPLR